MSLLKKSIKAAKIAIAAAAILVGATIANHYRTRNTVTADFHNGQIEYTHSDPQTTHILNYLAGKEVMSPQERLDILKSGMVNGCTHQTTITCPDFTSMDEENVFNWLMEMDAQDALKRERQVKKYNSLEEYLEGEYMPMPLQQPLNPTLYQTLWQLETQCGAPYIQFKFGLGINMFSNTPKYGHYQFPTNTIQLLPIDTVSTLISELAHAKQENDTPIGFYLGGIETSWRIAKKVAFDQMSVADAYDEEYVIRGSVEYQAHIIIEPQLKREYNLNQK